MKIFQLFLFISTIVVIEKCHGSAVYYLDQYLQNGSHVVRLKSITSSSSSLSLRASKCNYPVSGKYGLTVEGPTVTGGEYFMLVKVEKFNIRRTTSDKCVDVITIRNVYNGEIIYRGCWSNVTRSFKTGGTNTNSENTVVVKLELGNSTISYLDGFEMVFTMAKKCSHASFGQFHCWNGYCINSALKCDQEVNCLDGSDEFGNTCNNAFVTPSYRQMSINVGIPVGIIIFIAIAFACYVKYRRNRQSAQTTAYSSPPQPVQVTPPTNTTINTNQAFYHGPSPQQPYPPQYPPQPEQYGPQPGPYLLQPSQNGAQPQYNPAFEKEVPAAPAYGRY